MLLEKVIPFKSERGNKYLIKFEIFNSGIDFGIPIVDVSLILIESNSERIFLSELFCISNLIFEYLNNNDVVLYYYCDNKEINRSKKNNHMLPQQFRYELFSKLFERKKTNDLLKKDIIIGNEKEDIHYISLISSVNRLKEITEISNEVSRMNDK